MNIAPAMEKWDANATHPQGDFPAAIERPDPAHQKLRYRCRFAKYPVALKRITCIAFVYSIAGAAPAAAQPTFTARLERLQDNPARYCKRPLADLSKLNITGERGFTRGLGRSMLPAMKVGALALIWRLPQGFKLRRGMVLYFRGDYGNLWIKRLIGLPGDRVIYNQSPNGLNFTINGRRVNRSLKPAQVTLRWIRRDGRGKRLTGTDGAPQVRTETYRAYTETLPSGTKYRILHRPNGPPAEINRRLTVPPGRLFVLGDNRYRSRDSRHPGYGLIRTRYVFGLALCDVTDRELMED